jgi:hypothetical protein
MDPVRMVEDGPTEITDPLWDHFVRVVSLTDAQRQALAREGIHTFEGFFAAGGGHDFFEFDDKNDHPLFNKHVRATLHSAWDWLVENRDEHLDQHDPVPWFKSTFGTSFRADLARKKRAADQAREDEEQARELGVSNPPYQIKQTPRLLRQKEPVECKELPPCPRYIILTSYLSKSCHGS